MSVFWAVQEDCERVYVGNCHVPFFYLAHSLTKIKVEDQEAPKIVTSRFATLCNTIRQRCDPEITAPFYNAYPLETGAVVNCNLNLISVCTLKQSIGGTSSGFTNIKSNWNMSRSDWKCSPVHKYWLNQSKWTFSTYITEGVCYVYPRVGEWVTQREWYILQLVIFPKMLQIDT